MIVERIVSHAREKRTLNGDLERDQLGAVIAARTTTTSVENRYLARERMEPLLSVVVLHTTTY